MGAYTEGRLIGVDKLVKIPDGIDDISAAAVILKGMTTQFLIRKSFKVNGGCYCSSFCDFRYILSPIYVFDLSGFFGVLVKTE